MEWPTFKPLGTRRARMISGVLAVALLGTVAVATGYNPLTAILHLLARPLQFCGSDARTTAPTPHPPEITYIGSDGNVWDVLWPDGTPRQFTNDALQASETDSYSDISYGGLAWSPDGSRLAVLRTAGSITQETTDLLVFSPTGKVMLRTRLEGDTHGNPAWSPDGCALAYPSYGYPGQGDLVMLDAATGQTIKTLSYDFHDYLVCDPSGDQLDIGILDAEGGFLDNTFVWSPDEQSILLRYNCGTRGTGRVDLEFGDTTPHYPYYATYRPDTHQRQEVILGQWDTGSDTDARPVLGLTDADGNQIRTLVTGPVYTQLPRYANELGRGNWTSNGQAIYYEYEDGIWRINADGSGAHMIVAGTPLDSQGNATVEVVPTPSPDGRMLLYLHLQGNNQSRGFPAGQWNVAQADGANPVPLPGTTLGSGYTSLEAIWRPGT